MKPFKMFGLLVNSKLFIAIFVTSIYLGQPNSAVGQDVAQLAMQARINLYDNWDFDSVAYYLNQVIGEKYAPAFAYSDYGWYLMLLDRTKDGLAFIEQAAEMDASDKQLVTWNSWALYWSGDLPSAKQWINKALAIDPNYGEALHVSSMISSEMENHEEAIRLAHKAATKDPGWRAVVPLVLVKAGNQEQAKKWLEKIAQDESVNDVMLLMEVYANLKNDDKALDYLKKSYELRHPFMPWLNFYPGMKYLHDDPRFKTIVQKMNLPK